MPSHEQLLEDFHALAGPGLGVRGVAEGLLVRWSEPHRRYHDVRHLSECLAALSWLDAGPQERLAAWFHDAVYDGEAGEDERRSARLAESELRGLGLPEATVAEVVRLILLTIGHRAEPGDERGARLCDADLAILGAPRERYWQSVAAIRQEYSRFDDDQWHRGRLAVVERFLGSPSLFHTPAAAERWEASARANLQEERRRLTVGWLSCEA